MGRGDLHGTEVCYHDGHRVIEARDGSDQTLRQYVWGTEYIDEIVRVHRTPHGSGGQSEPPTEVGSQSEPPTEVGGHMSFHPRRSLATCNLGESRVPPTVDGDCLAEVNSAAEQTTESNTDESFYDHQDDNP